jgi:hypothetical protein
VPSDDLKESLEALAAMLDDIVTEPVGEHLAWQWGYRNARAFALQDIAEVLEIGVPAAHDGVFQFEGGDVGSANDLVRRVHVPRSTMGLGVADLGVFVRLGVRLVWVTEVMTLI